VCQNLSVIIELGDDEVRLRRSGVRFPVELRPTGLDPQEPGTWPRVEGRLELVGGRLLYMPPCGDIQQDVAMDVALVLRRWADEQPEFVVGGNEAGMYLAGDVRGADAAVWRRASLGARTGKYRPVPPVLAVEVAGEDEGEPELREKARWYLAHGVAVVWLVLPDTREVVVITAQGDSRHGKGERLPRHPELPSLEPPVDRFFVQIDR
jgi:Uma2 family endonuclease